MNLVVTVDAEEDNWAEFRPTGQTVHNIDRIPELQRLFEEFDVAPAYLVTYPVVVDETASSIFHSVLAGGRCEIGTHCHPWNTPPFEESHHLARDSMLCNLPPALQYAKIWRLHETIERTLGAKPVTFRSGRWGFGADVASHLVDIGYRVDTSMTPYVDWSSDHGPDFSMIAPRPFFLWPDRAAPSPRPLLEVPVTIGFLQSNFAFRNAMLKTVQRPPIHRLRLAGPLYRLGIATKVWLSPEVSTAPQMVRLTKQMQRQNCSVVNLTFHSPCLQPGLTPFARSRADAHRLIGRLRDYLTFARAAGIKPIKLSDVLDMV